MYQLPIDMTTRIPSVNRATMSPPRQSASRPYGLSTTSVARIEGAAAGAGAAGLRQQARRARQRPARRVAPAPRRPAAGPSGSRRWTGPRPRRPIGSSSAWCLQAINDSVRKPGYGPTVRTMHASAEGNPPAARQAVVCSHPDPRMRPALPVAPWRCAIPKTASGEIRRREGENTKTHWPRSVAGPSFVGKPRDSTRSPDVVQPGRADAGCRRGRGSSPPETERGIAAEPGGVRRYWTSGNASAMV